MIKCSITTRYRQWFLLLCYGTVLIPGVYRQVLCINQCGAVSIETKAHQCHGGEHTSTDLHHDPAREILSSTLTRETSHSAYCCVDIPLVTETPQLVVTDMVRGPVASYVPRNILGPDEGPALCVMNRVADPPPEQRTIAATVLLL